MGYPKVTITPPVAIETRRYDPKHFILPIAYIELEKITYYDDHHRPQSVQFRLFRVQDLHHSGSSIRFNPWEIIETIKVRQDEMRFGPFKDPASRAAYTSKPLSDFWIKQIDALQEVSQAMKDLINNLIKLKLGGTEAQQKFEFKIVHPKNDKYRYIHVFKGSEVGDAPNEVHVWENEVDELMKYGVAEAA